MGIFWVFRIIVALAVQHGGDFGGFISFDNTFEIILLFVTLVCFLLVVKRKIIGGIIYLAGYAWYFGGYIFKNLIPILVEGQEMDIVVLQNSIVGMIGIIIALVVVIDIAFERTKTKHFTDNKTDWYFGTDKYDREMDERADKNQYRTL